MSSYENKYAKLNIQSQIIEKLIEENQPKLDKECLGTIDKILSNEYESKLVINPFGHVSRIKVK